jgi:hypothetical protein
MSERQAGRELDAEVAEKVMGLDVRGKACAIFVEGEWSIHADSEPDGWACYAGIEPVYRIDREYVTPPPERRTDCIGRRPRVTAQMVEVWYQKELAAYERDIERFGCHSHDLDVVPLYSTNIAEAMQIVDRWTARGYRVSLGTTFSLDDGNANGWHVDIGGIDARVYDLAQLPLAISLAALSAADKETEASMRYRNGYTSPYTTGVMPVVSTSPPCPHYHAVCRITDGKSHKSYKRGLRSDGLKVPFGTRSGYSCPDSIPLPAGPACGAT